MKIELSESYLKSCIARTIRNNFDKAVYDVHTEKIPQRFEKPTFFIKRENLRIRQGLHSELRKKSVAEYFFVVTYFPSDSNTQKKNMDEVVDTLDTIFEKLPLYSKDFKEVLHLHRLVDIEINESDGVLVCTLNIVINREIEIEHKKVQELDYNIIIKEEE